MLQMVRHIIMQIMLIQIGQNYKRRLKLAGIFSTKAKVTKLTEQKELFNMNKDLITICVSITIVLCTTIVGGFMYNLNDRNNMAKNIEAAITKGVDPLSVKCAYETGANPVCITMAATKK
jgi:hypothetical protein